MIDLRHRYNFNNKKYFGGKLPLDIDLEWSERQPIDGIAASHPHGVLPCDPNFCIEGCSRSFIRIDPILKNLDSVSEITLLHEQVHIKSLLGNRNLAYHGEAFNMEMLRLAKLGAFNNFW